MTDFGTPTEDWDVTGVTDDFSTPVSDSNAGSQNDWDDWGNTPSQETGVDDSQFTPQAQDEGWDDWGSDSGQAQDFQSEQSDWDDWGSNTQEQQSSNQQNGSFIPQEQETWGDWQGNQQGINQNPIADEGFTDFASNLQSPVQEVVPKQFNFSTKTVAIILAGVFLVIAFILLGVSKIHIDKKPETTQSVQTQQPTQQQQTSSEPASGSSSKQTVNTVDGSVTLVEIPDSVALNYSMDVLEVNGTVREKLKYVQGHQVLYCVVIDISFAGSSETVNYYCNSASYNQVSQGDLVFVEYQQVNDEYVSIVSIKK